MGVELRTSPNTKYSNNAFAKRTGKKLLLTKELVIIEHILSAYFELSEIGTLASNPALFKRNKSLKNTEHTSPVAIPLIKSYMFQFATRIWVQYKLNRSLRMPWRKTSYVLFGSFGEELKKVLAISFFLLSSSGVKNSLILFMGFVVFSTVSPKLKNSKQSSKAVSSMNETTSLSPRTSLGSTLFIGSVFR